MIVIAPSLKMLSNEVTLQTATAVKEFFALCQAAGPNYYVPLPKASQEKLVELNRTFGRLAGSQSRLLNALELVTDDQVTSAEFAKVISDLGLVVAQVESAIVETYAAPEFVSVLLRNNLERVADQNSHLDSYVESFHVAFDENCSSLLADLGTKVLAG
jgi:hypothetical protein